MSLDPELKKQWVDALRSGEYKQTKGTLHNLGDGGFCCIGVACVVWGIATPEEIGVKMFNGNPVGEGAKIWYTRWEDHFRRYKPKVTLTKMNDSGNYTFNEIADWIEEKL